MARNPTITADRPTTKRIGALRALWPFVRPYRALLVAALVALGVTAGISLVLPLAVRRVVDGFDAGAQLLDQYFGAALAIVALLAVGTGLRYYLVTRLGERVVADIRKAVQRRWDDVVRKWPQPMLTRRGRYEVATGVIEREGVGTFPVRIHLWLDPGDSPTSLISWGGWAEPHGSEDELRELMWSEFGPGRGLDTLTITGRTSARILITGMSSQIVFSGSSAYPQVAS